MQIRESLAEFKLLAINRVGLEGLLPIHSLLGGRVLRITDRKQFTRGRSSSSEPQGVIRLSAANL
jgi:hypothetical protein